MSEVTIVECRLCGKKYKSWMFMCPKPGTDPSCCDECNKEASNDIRKQG